MAGSILRREELGLRTVSHTVSLPCLGPQESVNCRRMLQADGSVRDQSIFMCDYGYCGSVRQLVARTVCIIDHTVTYYDWDRGVARWLSG